MSQKQKGNVFATLQRCCIYAENLTYPVVVEDLVKGDEGKEVKGGLQGRLEGNGWHYWKEEQKLGGGAHQGQSNWSKITGAMDL
ncbi:hypothetical protein BY996DRAFT_6501260 [Phakopsora pachyrhizi]|uniref:Uncharacterized protein n=1 Tax=Phakopsora pachyrhizi TaxID=170000 RepID=A0AAV0AUK9_PHAPC|nr:hypothetical protein BY996DRAFT_6501260 [Phakopsora pachyrhizi]CAH7671673.1 hypothetical protein PPACK8108_LOCUS6475 [Phakopsora pachyrhizi]